MHTLSALGSKEARHHGKRTRRVIVNAPQAAKVREVVGTTKKLPEKHELTGWMEGDYVCMFLKVGQFECSVKAHRGPSDAALEFRALSEGLLAALKDADALHTKVSPSTF